MARAYQINDLFFNIYGTVNPYRFCLSWGFYIKKKRSVPQTFLKDCANNLRRSRRDLVLQVSATFSSADEPQESVVPLTFSSIVQPYLVNGTAILVNDRYGHFFLRKLDGVLFINCIV